MRSAICSCGARASTRGCARDDRQPHGQPALRRSLRRHLWRVRRLEALEAIEAAGVKTKQPIEVVAWTNEEGGRFQPCTMGSAVFTGQRRWQISRGARQRGVRLGDALRATLAATPEAEPRELLSPVSAYVEAHIEQGPLLERAGKPIGAVTVFRGCAGSTSRCSARRRTQARLRSRFERTQCVTRSPSSTRSPSLRATQAMSRVLPWVACW